jgi:two-component system nitrate/nitrite response regulator NarL
MSDDLTYAIRVLVVADDPLARAGLAVLLEEAGAVVVGRDAGADIAGAVVAYRPDVVVWDVGAEGAHVPDALGGLELPTILLLPNDVELSLFITLDARGLVSRGVEVDTLAAALGAVICGLTVLGPPFDQAQGQSIPPLPLLEALTLRESAVLQLLAEGLSNKTIAKRLELSESTVKFHLASIYGKLGARSRTEAVTRAAKLGLILL